MESTNSNEIISRFRVKLDDKNRFTIPKASIDSLLVKFSKKGTCRLTTYKDKIVIDDFKEVDNVNQV